MTPDDERIARVEHDLEQRFGCGSGSPYITVSQVMAYTRKCYGKVDKMFSSPKLIRDVRQDGSHCKRTVHYKDFARYWILYYGRK